MLYTSEITGKSYKTVEELEEAEAKAEAKKKEKEKLLEEKKTRAKEVENAYTEYLKVRDDAYKAIQEAEKKWIELRNKFAKDYNGYHMTYINNNGVREVTFGDLVDTFFNW